MKKLIITLGILSLLIPNTFSIQKKSGNLEENHNVKNANYNATLKGFYISDEYEYCGEQEESEYRELYNGSRYYGKYSMWASTFKFWDSVHDTMYYLCLAETTIEPSNKSYWDNYGWYNEKMLLSTSVNVEDARYVCSTPEAYEKETTKTWGISGTISGTYSEEASINVSKEAGLSASAGVGTQMGISLTASYSETTLTPSVTVEVSTGGTKKNNKTITYKFNRCKYHDNNDCCHSFVSKKYMYIYSINNYARYRLKDIYVDYSYTPTIYRAGRFNQTSLSAKEPLVYSIKVN